MQAMATTATAVPPAAIRELQQALAPDRVLSSAEDLIVFEYDGTIERGTPQVVVFPDTVEEVAGGQRRWGEMCWKTSEIEMTASGRPLRTSGM